jgi:hypothetical protein
MQVWVTEKTGEKRKDGIENNKVSQEVINIIQSEQ